MRASILTRALARTALLSAPLAALPAAELGVVNGGFDDLSGLQPFGVGIYLRSGTTERSIHRVASERPESGNGQFAQEHPV
jgi:hypothetical protein